MKVSTENVDLCEKYCKKCIFTGAVEITISMVVEKLSSNGGNPRVLSALEKIVNT